MSTSLPPDITEAILRLLPAKSLGRFKSVSKSWNSLISNPQFIKTHLLHLHSNTTKLILLSDTKSLYSLHINPDLSTTLNQLTFPPRQTTWEQILGSCNGIVLAKDELDSIFLINPTTKELLNLPVSPYALPDDESFIMYGFGYDSSSDDYKVVSISFWDTDNEHNPDCTDMFVSVYSLRNNSWRKLNNSPYDHAVGHLASGVLVDQKLHWLTSTRPGYSSTIVAFSLESEAFNEIELPGLIDNEKCVFNELVVLGGKLCMFGTRVGNDLWVMEQYGVGESWTRVCIDGVEVDDVKPVCMVEGSDRDIVLVGDDEVVVYNVDERQCTNVRVEGVTGGVTSGHSHYQYCPLCPLRAHEFVFGYPKRVGGFAVGGAYLESLESPKFISGAS